MAKINLVSNPFPVLISDVSKLNVIESPEVFTHGIPWKIKIYKKDYGGTYYLACYLYCANKNPSEDWSYSASCSFKLLPFDDNRNMIERTIEPYVFDRSGIGFGCLTFIEWNRLLNIENGYIEEDSIKMEFKIEAENPKKVDRSKMIFECVNRSCDGGCLANFRLTVTNVENLLAVNSPNFNLRGIPFNLTVYKDQTSKLGTRLFRSDGSEQISFKIKMTAKILSTKKDEFSIAKTQSQEMKKLSIFERDLISWEELMNPEKGYVNENSIVIEVKIESGKRNGDASNGSASGATNEAKTPKLECAICLENINDQSVSNVPCGHLFCTDCITRTINVRKMCPTCNTAVELNDVRRIYLPM